MSEIDLLPRLWGGRITDYRFDFVTHTIRMVVFCPISSSVTETYDLVMEEVLSFCYAPDARIPPRAHLTEPWAYVDLSSIVASRITINADDYWKVEAELWDTELEVVCGELHIRQANGSLEKDTLSPGAEGNTPPL